jgi:two-component system CheB/CheR fusion protein
MPTVVGIGASAGGLQALEEFFGACAALQGVSFVVVQHLSPDLPSLLPELLQRVTPLPVAKILDDTELRPDRVYVAPPGFDVRLDGDRLVLDAQADAEQPHLPIDSFFRSLASQAGWATVGVVLSGMGSDGTEGLRELRGGGGAAFVQAPETAQYDSMPASAIKEGLGDVVAPPDALPALIADYLEHLRLSISEAPAGGHMRPHALAPSGSGESGALTAILALLKARTGHDFADYKKSTLRRRVERRMAIYHVQTQLEYQGVLRDNPSEVDLLFKEMLIGVTSFFRDPPVWEHLQAIALPDLIAHRHAEHRPLRLWVTGCSTGEEVYSLAMVLTDALQSLKPGMRPAFKIFATDIDADAIDFARRAKYPPSTSKDVSADRLARFFIEDESGFRVRKELRERVIFAVQNVAMDPPFTKLDMLVCRNLLIYFEPGLQRQLLPLFHYSLEPGGLLLLGSAETVGPATEYFLPLPGKFKLYRRLDTFRGGSALGLSSVGMERRSSPMHDEVAALGPVSETPPMHTVVESLLLQRHMPAAVLVTREGDVLYICGKTGRYLEPAAGRANWNVFAMARQGLARPLGHAFKEALAEQRQVVTSGMVLDPPFGNRHYKLTIDPVSVPGAAMGMVLIVFTDIEPLPILEVDNEPRPSPVDFKSRPGSGASEVRHLRDALRSALDEAQNVDEQLRAANEELQSTNEEIQSTNEELTTSKEELQSMNEELQTVNQELQSKVDELSQASDDMRNLLNSTEIATLFLDEALGVRRYTVQCTHIFKLIPGDTGRPITDISNDLKNWDVQADAADVLGSLVPKETEIGASGGRWFRVRVMPYRTSSNRIDGVVITFADISQFKRMERELTRAKGVLEGKLRRRQPAAK